MGKIASISTGPRFVEPLSAVSDVAPWDTLPAAGLRGAGGFILPWRLDPLADRPVADVPTLLLIFFSAATADIEPFELPDSVDEALLSPSGLLCWGLL
jgi:hypothetical protein